MVRDEAESPGRMAHGGGRLNETMYLPEVSANAAAQRSTRSLIALESSSFLRSDCERFRRLTEQWKSH